jgi:hypothetical protein
MAPISRCVASAIAVLCCTFAARGADKFPEPTDEERLELIRRARVWEPGDVAARNLYDGPPGRLPYAVDAEVACDFVPKQMTGWSEKFACRLDDGTVVKVKYNRPDAYYKEAFGEVLGTRIFWALGFYADRMIPVHVTCRGCPENPFEYVDSRKRVSVDDDRRIESLPHDAFVGTYRFEIAAIEEPLDGATIEQEDRQGWDWELLEEIDASAGGSSRAEVDALKLLNAFVQNADNKPAQNTLACPRAQIVAGEGGKQECRRPVMYVDDLGSVFGEGGIATGGSGRIDFEGWRSRKVWRDEKKCRARLTSIGGPFRSGTLKDPVIGEAGRALLAEQLAKLSDRQIADLFRAARVELLELTVRDGARGKRPVTIEDWVELFKAKRSEITDHPGCPAR